MPQPAMDVQLSPRDCFRVHAALEAAVRDLGSLDFEDSYQRQCFEDLEQRFRKLLKDGGFCHATL